MSTHDASPANPIATASVRPKPVQAFVGLVVLFAVVGVVAKGAVGWARDFGILPYTGPIIEAASLRAEAWDPSARALNIEATATPHRGPERYAACGFRVRVLSSADAGASVLAVYENCAPIDGPGDDKRVLAGANGIPVPTSSRFRTVAQRAGLKTLCLHDLRHGFCSRLAQANVPLPTISALAGHKSWTTTQRYACHLPEGATLAAIRAMETNEQCPPPKKNRKPS